MNIQEIVFDISHRLRDPEVLQQTLAQTSRKSSMAFFNNPLSLSNGYPGLILLFSVLDELYPGEKWDEACHGYVVKIKEEIESKGIKSLSLFEGLAGCAFSLRHASKENCYKKLIQKFNDFLLSKIDTTYFPICREKIDLKLPLRPDYYDLISGISGIGLYLLKNLEDPRVVSYLHKILNFCICMTKDIHWSSLVLPGWYVPRHYQFTQIDQQNFPQGNFNLGLAHGISGVLGFLSIAILSGIEIEGQQEAIHKIKDWLMKKLDKQMVFWPNRISFSSEISRQELSHDRSSLEAWCYGTPGIARVLYLTGRALKEEVLQKMSINAFLKMIQRNHEQHSFQTPTFCHGLAGLHTLSKLMARDTHMNQFHEFSSELEKKFLTLYDPKAPFGFKDRELIIKDQNLLDIPWEPGLLYEYNEYDKIGFLDGVTGVLLALLSEKNESFSWAFPFAIEGN